MLEYLHKIYKSGLEKNCDVVGVSYLIDLLCLQMMPMFGGDKSVVKDLKNNVQNEMIAFNASPAVRNTVDELKKAGIDFSVVYDMKKKAVVPSIDVSKIQLSDADMKKWVAQNFDRISDLMKERDKNANS